MRSNNKRFLFLVDHLVHVLRAFYTNHEQYRISPLYIFGQGHGAQLAVSLAIQLVDEVSMLSLLFYIPLKNIYFYYLLSQIKVFQPHSMHIFDLPIC